jgi:YD repeat-containing protein
MNTFFAKTCKNAALTISCLTIAWSIFFYGLLEFPLPWKTLDPNDPSFKVERFRPTDYGLTMGWIGQKKYTPYFLNDVFPPGTKKEYVDQILVDQAGMSIYPIRTEKVDQKAFRYNYTNHFRSYIMAFTTMTRPDGYDWTYIATYDAQGRLIEIRCT